jgi:hypothetical protein
MRPGTAIAEGLIGGASGAGCMMVLRMAARRAGWVDLTPHQATKDWLVERAGRTPRDTGAHQMLDALVHWTALFGLGVWAIAFGVIAPALRITRPPREGNWQETAVNVAAHLTYGVATALVSGELGRQTQGPRGARGRLRARVG